MPVTHKLHLVSLQIEDGAMYGILSSKCYHIFVRRSADAASRHADFSDTFDSVADIALPLLDLLIPAEYGSEHAKVGPQSTAHDSCRAEMGPCQQKEEMTRAWDE